MVLDDSQNKNRKIQNGSYRTMIIAILILFVMITFHKKRELPSSTMATTSSSSSSKQVPSIIHHHHTTGTICPKVDLTLPELQPLFKSQSKEDRTLLEWFNGLCGGTYIEMGGLDGVTLSNTHFFNKGPLQWKGVLIEANPKTFPKLQINRPNEIATVHAAVCDKKQTIHYVWIDHPHKEALGGIWEFAPPSFRKKWWGGITLDQTTPIECLPLHEILLEHAGNKTISSGPRSSSSKAGVDAKELDEPAPYFYFDFFSLDIEGAELEALQSLNFDQVGFGIILIEADEHNPRKNMALRTFVESKGYIFLYDKDRSFWFANGDFSTIYKDVLHSLE